MVISFFEKFDLVFAFAGGEQLLEAGDYFGLIHLCLFEESARHTEGDFEGGIFLDEFCEHSCGGQIAFIGDLFEYFLVHLIPDELVPCGMQPERLVQLKIKCRYRHFLPFFDINCNLGPANNALRTQPNRFNQTTYAARGDCNPLRRKTQRNWACGD
jgi:hypothetical protein